MKSFFLSTQHSAEFPRRVIATITKSPNVTKCSATHAHTKPGRLDKIKLITIQKWEPNEIFSCKKKQRSLWSRRNGGGERERVQESIKRCQRGWACPLPCEDWNNECVLGEHLPLMPNVGNAFWDQRAQMTKFSKKKNGTHKNRYCCTVVLCSVHVRSLHASLSLTS